MAKCHKAQDSILQASETRVRTRLLLIAALLTKSIQAFLEGYTLDQVDASLLCPHIARETSSRLLVCSWCGSRALSSRAF